MKRLFGFLAITGLMLFALPTGRAEAVSLINPGAAAQTKSLSDDLIVEVQHRGGFRGGFRGGGRHFGHGHFGHRHFGHRHFGHRHVHFHRPHFHRPHFHRRFVHRHYWRPRPIYYPRYYAQPRLFCRRVWTDFGPRRICRYRPWSV